MGSSVISLRQNADLQPNPFECVLLQLSPSPFVLGRDSAAFLREDFTARRQTVGGSISFDIDVARFDIVDFCAELFHASPYRSKIRTEFEQFYFDLLLLTIIA